MQGTPAAKSYCVHTSVVIIKFDELFCTMEEINLNIVGRTEVWQSINIGDAGDSLPSYEIIYSDRNGCNVLRLVS